MSLYRQPGRVSARTVALVALAALSAGLGIGYAVGHGNAPEPSLAGQLGGVRNRLQPAHQGLELVRTEYPQAVRDGRVAEPTEYRAAQQDVGRVRGALDGAAADLRALSAARAAAADRAVTALDAAVDGRASTAEVDRLSRAADTAISAAAGGG